MATEKQDFFAKFLHWYGSYQGKSVVNIIYSAGASVVIVGALFKILHWPGASQVLMIGMFTEAFLFLIGTLEKPNPEFHWENVFPQLLEYGAKPELLEAKSKQARPTLLGAGVEGERNFTGNFQNHTTTPSGPISHTKAPVLKEEEYSVLKESITNLAKTASQLSELNKVAQAGIRLGEKLSAAGEATEAYSARMTEAADLYANKLIAAGDATETYTYAAVDLAKNYALISADMQKVADETKAYKQGVEEVSKNIAALNSVYELQLQSVNDHADAVKRAANAAKETAEAQLAFAASAKQLQKQVADLSGIYGNMLNALA